jgi:hypothetical protein
VQEDIMPAPRYLAPLFALLLGLGTMPAQTHLGPSGSATPDATATVIDRMAERERTLVAAMRGYHPLAESYFQTVRPDEELGSVPVSDRYYLGRLAFDEGYHERLYTTDLERSGWKAAARSTLAPARQLGKFVTVDFLQTGFSGMIFPDARGFDRENYSFVFLRREFLGEVRCLVFSVAPKRQSENGRFMGRIWIEDRDYNLVRFNGTYVHPGFLDTYFHMDSWRNNLRPGLWLPVMVYMEESSLKAGLLKRTLRFKGQTRLWGYDLSHAGRQEEFTDVEVEQKDGVKDESEAGLDLSPVMSLQAWEREAEDNILDRLEQAGLLAPASPVDQVLTTIVNNLEATNELDPNLDVRCRVLLTSPLETLAIGNTIVISRGLLDVVPDEAALAAVLAHELAHIAAGHPTLDTKYAFADRLLISDEQTYSAFDFPLGAKQEQEADTLALKLLQNSPYKDKLAGAGLFLRQVEARAEALPNLTRARLGNSFTDGGKVTRMSKLMNSAPQLQLRTLDQRAALPLGGRIRVNAWSGQVELMKTKPAQPMYPSEKMPLEVAPVVMRLSRFPAAPAGPVLALVSPPQ